MRPDDLFPTPDEQALGPLPDGAVNRGSLHDLLPDSNPTGEYVPAAPRVAVSSPRVGRFELRRQLGKGGCGIVFLAYDPKLKREVALKIPRPELLLSEDARRRLVREAHAAAEFDHPNLVPVYETGEIGPVCFIATAFCPGQTLAEWIDRQAFPVPVRQAARLVAQLAEAVQHAHDRGVLHRDLKPNNVILQEGRADPNDQGPPPGACPLRGEHYVPRVVDFGLAKLDDRGPNETASRQILGTPKYMAPEQAQARREDVGPEADVYALGVVLYELLAGRVPYDGPTDVDVLRQVIEGQLTPPRSVRRDIPRDLEAICLRAMARTPARRYRTAIDLADDLRRFIDGLPTLARPLNPFQRAAKWLRRNDQRVALAVVSAIALVVLPIGMWFVHQTGRLRDDQRTTQAERQVRDRRDRERDYARHVHYAFLAWRAGDARQMADSLGQAGQVAGDPGETTDFTWGYLSQLGRVERLSATSPAGAVGALAVAPDGTRAVTGHPNGTLTVWNPQTGAILGKVAAHPGGVTHVSFLAGGSAVVTAGGEPAARVWVLGANGVPAPGPVLRPFAAAVTALAASADGKLLYLGSATGDCAVWDAAGNRAVKVWPATGGEAVTAVAAAPDGKTLATGGRTEPVRLWPLDRDEPATDVRGAAGAPALAFAPDAAGGWLLAAAGRDDGTVRLYDPLGREVRNLPGHAGPVLAVAVSPDGSAVASGGNDDSVCVWDVATGSMRTLLRGHDNPVRGVRFGPDGRTLYTAGDDGNLKAWDLTADPEGPVLRGLATGVSALAGRGDTREFAVAYTDGSVEVYASRGGPPRRFPGAGRGGLSQLHYPKAGPPLGVEVTGRAVVVWEFGDAPRVVLRADTPAQSDLPSSIPGPASATTAELSLAAGVLAVGDDHGVVRMWSLADGTPRARFDTTVQGPVRHLRISDDGVWVASQTFGHAVGIWTVNEGLPFYRVPGHGDGTWLVRFLPGGRQIVTAGRGSSIKVWNVDTGKDDLSLLGHVGRVTGLAVSPDGRTLVSGSGTGEVKLWDLRTGQELLGLRRHAGLVTAAEFAGDGKVLLTAALTPGGRSELAFWDAGRE